MATILFPIFLIRFNINLNLSIIPLFILLFALFKFLNINAHNLYLKNKDEELDNIEKPKKLSYKIILYYFVLVFCVVSLYFISINLGNSLENLCVFFHIPQFMIGIILGFITSIPELITFFEAQKHHKTDDNDMDGVVEATNNLLLSNLFNLYIIPSIGLLLVNI